MRFETLHEAQLGIPILYPNMIFADFEMNPDQTIREYAILDINGKVLISCRDSSTKVTGFRASKVDYMFFYDFFYKLMYYLEGKTCIVYGSQDVQFLNNTIDKFNNNYPELKYEPKTINLENLQDKFYDYMGNTELIESKPIQYSLSDCNKVLGGNGIQRTPHEALWDTKLLYDTFCRLNSKSCCMSLDKVDKTYTKAEIDKMLSEEVSFVRKSYYRYKLAEMERRGVEEIAL